MYKFLFFLIIFFISLFESSAQNADDSCYVLITLKDYTETPVKGYPLRVFNNEKLLVARGLTDERGIYQIELSKPKDYIVIVYVNRQDLSFSLNLPDAPGKYTFNAVYKIPVPKQNIVLPTDAEFPKSLGNVETSIILQNKERVKLPNHEFTIFNADSTVLMQAQTDEEGQFLTKLESGKNYAVYTKVDEKEFISDFEVPKDVEFYAFRFIMSFTKTVDSIYANATAKNITITSFTLEGVYFDTGKWDIRPESYPALNDLVKVLKQRPTMVIEIGGHTDNVGDDASNIILSRNRANSVRSYIINQGIEPERVQSKGYGENAPIATNDTPEGKQKNRRIEVKVISE